MIKELTRRVNLQNVWQAIYTSGSVFPSPFGYANYYHRNLNPKKNYETGFTYKAKNMSMAKYIKSHSLPLLEEIPIAGNVRPMTKSDFADVYALYKNKMKDMQIYFKYSQDELGHQLLSREGVIYTLVVEQEDKKVTDFISFYNLPSQVLKQEGHQHTSMNVSLFDFANSFQIAYLYYWACTVNEPTNFMMYALNYAKNMVGEGNNFDVFNCLNIMDNEQFLEACKFGTGDGILNFYLFNFGIKD